MSNPTTYLLSDDRAEQLEQCANEALSQLDWLPAVAKDFVMATKVLLRDRESRIIMAAAEAK